MNRDVFRLLYRTQLHTSASNCKTERQRERDRQRELDMLRESWWSINLMFWRREEHICRWRCSRRWVLSSQNDATHQRHQLRATRKHKQCNNEWTVTNTHTHGISARWMCVHELTMTPAVPRKPPNTSGAFDWNTLLITPGQLWDRQTHRQTGEWFVKKTIYNMCRETENKLTEYVICWKMLPSGHVSRTNTSMAPPMPQQLNWHTRVELWVFL